jgi:glycosyltransferase involved in cell wall biosynthesis
MTYKISMIMPVYNGEKYINKAMNSLIKQTIGFNNNN